jgi:hypothetical protein
MLTMAHEPVIRAGAFNHVSPYFADVVWRGLSTWHVREGLDGHITPDALRRVWMPISPWPFIRRVDGRAVLLIYARYDLTFPVDLSRVSEARWRRPGLLRDPVFGRRAPRIAEQISQLAQFLRNKTGSLKRPGLLDHRYRNRPRSASKMTLPRARMKGVTSPVEMAVDTASAPRTGSVSSSQIVAPARVAARTPISATRLTLHRATLIRRSV